MTTIGTDATALLALPGGITLLQPVTVMQKGGGSTAPAIDNLAGTNILAGPITLAGGGTYWNIRSDSGDLIMQGASTVLSILTGSRILILSGYGNGEWWGNLSTSTANMSLNKQDGGTWTLWGTNGYPGKTSVSAGQLNVNGALTGTASVTVGTDMMGSGAVLSGTGLITGPVTNTGFSTLCGNSVLASGIPSGAPAGRLTISNSLTMKPASMTIVGVSPSGCDQVAGLSQVTYSGTLQVVVTTGTLVGGEAFKLFDSTAYSGTDFDTYTLPDLGTPLLSWDTTSVPVNGTLRVTGSVAPQVLSISSTGPGNLQFSGTGPTNWTYSILATTNITQPLSNWVEVSSGAFTNGTFTFSDANAATYPHRFYRVVTQFQ
jgi:autotransporter-associated beta strand protein